MQGGKFSPLTVAVLTKRNSKMYEFLQEFDNGGSITVKEPREDFSRSRQGQKFTAGSD